MEATLRIPKSVLFSLTYFGTKSRKINLISSHRFYSDVSNHSLPKKTCLYDFHVEKGGKIVNFAGFQMPVQYNDLSINESHLHTRAHSSLFDVSHMLQMLVKGKDRIEFMESITVADIQSLKEDSGSLSLYTKENGGIIDDLIVTKTSKDYLYVVSNAGRIEQDLAHVNSKRESFKSKGKDVSIEIQENRALIALQGPDSAKCLQPLVDCDLSKLYFMTSVLTKVCGVDESRITRCGYTGEDGFEISIPADKSVYVANSILSSSKGIVKLAGLGARDTLRLEAGLCLYGNDIDENTSPVEASLVWTIGKRRKEMANFIGAQIILKQLKEKPTKRRVGLIGLSSGPAARGHAPLLDSNTKKVIGQVTSGCPSPSLRKNIAMGYLPLTHTKVGTKVVCDIRGKHFEYEVVKMPFVDTKYYLNK
jgi:aminomethyltransferase